MRQRDSLSKNTFLLMFGTLLNKGLQFLVVPFFSRWLSTAEFGEFDLLCTYVSLLIPIISLSVQEAMFRFSIDEVDECKKKVHISNSFAIYFVNYVIAVCILLCFREEVKSGIFTIFCFYLFSELFSVFLRGYLRAIKKLNIYSISMGISSVFMSIFVTIFVYFMQMGLEGILLGYAVGTFMGDLLICFLSKFPQMLTFGHMKINKMKELIFYSAPLIPNDIAWWVMNASDRQLINMFFGSSANGIYAITHKIPALCSVIFNMFSISWQQEVVVRINDEKHEEYFNMVLNYLLRILLTLCAGLLAGSFIIYYYIFDKKYFEAISYSPILIFAAVFLAISQFFGGIQIALKQPKQNGITTVIGASVNLLAHLILYRYVGLYAAAISTFLANVVILYLRAVLVKSAFRIHFTKETIYVFIGFLYFFLIAYLHTNMVFNWINLFLACIFFVAVNREFIPKIITKLYKR